MERIDKIMQHPLFQDAMKTIEQAEVDRIYCLHGMDHSIDVARICHILNLEMECGYKRDVVYAAALLHDVGRCREYTEGKSHHIESADMAREILGVCGYDEEEIALVSTAILHHKRKSEDINPCDLDEILYKADKLSRKCYDCKAAASCYWSSEMKNNTVTF